VRGEILWPWGVRAARALDLERVFLEAGGQVVPVFDIYDELTPEPLRMEVSDVSPRLPSRSSTPAQPSPRSN